MLRRLVLVVATLIAMCLLGFCVLVNLANAPHKSDTDATNRSNAELIVGALEAHRAEHGSYPADLSELAGDLPASDPIRYEREEEAFILTYPEAPFGVLPSDGEYAYDSRRGSWELRVY